MKKKKIYRVSLRQVIVKKDLDKITRGDIFKAEHEMFSVLREFRFSDFLEAFSLMAKIVDDPVPPVYVPERQSWLITYARFDIAENKRLLDNLSLTFSTSTEIGKREKEVKTA